MTERFLVTGGAGFIGSHLTDALINRGAAVTVVDNEATGRVEHVNPAADYHKLDIRDREALRAVFADGFDAVLHVAGQVSCIRSYDRPDYDIDVNLCGTVEVVQACLAHRVPRLLYASSMSVYGPPAALPIEEDQAAIPLSYYAISKYAAERFVMATGERCDLDQPLDATAFRMYNVYGPRQDLDNPYQGVLAIFMAGFLKGTGVDIYGDGEQTRDFVYVDDVVNAWLAALSRPESFGRVYNVGSGEALTINRMAELVRDLSGRVDVPIRHQPPRPGEQRHVRAGTERALRELGWRARCPLDEGLEKTLRWAEAELDA